ncbi:uncharacterized protein BKA55DRAFT_689049 [Fusarium redolens]|uniref:Uncharacterized protein n=1 Tax=Fusarium redolens TaxID=48865 RepID=A0A9P9HBD4_FUSRE|nr:uncharacterized protein BKA55DRAFT_689049 [Fusarium redolens]KAH7253552.1 hypothetical protein BKA55DRAFT_689049 [Fusarium redolens]
MKPELSKDDVKRIRSFFRGEPRLVLSEQNPEKYHLTQCVWAPKSASRHNANETCPELESFFTDLLGVHKTDISVISKQSVEVTTSVELPRSLGAWPLGDPSHPDAKQTDPKLVYLVGTILRVKYHKISAIKDILDGEGIVNVDKLQCSIHCTQNQNQKSPHLFSAQPPSLVSSRSTLDSIRTSTPAQVDGLAQQVWSLSFQGNKDNSTTEDSGWVKYF